VPLSEPLSLEPPPAAIAVAARARPARVAIVADMLEEQWPSMDLVADLLVRELPSQHVWAVEPLLIRPPLVPVIGRLTPRSRGIPTADRVFNRFWLYRRALRAARRAGCGIYHIVDHSYAHLTLDLPPGRAIVTCHDADAFRGFDAPGTIDAGLPAFLIRRLVAGLRRARFVACPSHATADELTAARLVDPRLIAVVPNGVDASAPDSRAQADADRLLASKRPVVDVLHVGSTIPRKRIDLLLDVFARIASVLPELRLVRVGGAFTTAQDTRAARLGVRDRILVLPFLRRPVVWAVYRRAAITVLTSDREGFGLPLVESLAAGVPVVARDLPVFREVGGDCATYVAGDDPERWASAVGALLNERSQNPSRWQARRFAGAQRAELFSWARYAAAMADLYRTVAESV
jgi:glycosyltransferase involved in cell wall biosynthesis